MAAGHSCGMAPLQQSLSVSMPLSKVLLPPHAMFSATRLSVVNICTKMLLDETITESSLSIRNVVLLC